ncbi:DUF7738 domain-containing protein [Burkholderia sp. AU4i]|uniref:DUF7738 domain-containing protein n=1 Tax=Burkholderia sp. AU4i TaxID=1335308 RepID=UPI0012DFD929|nr:hypothetical protein [Burkholderia sp. AU4i]
MTKINPIWAPLLAVLMFFSGCSRAQSESPSAPGHDTEDRVIGLLGQAVNIAEQVDDLAHGVPRKAPRGAKPELIVENNHITLDGKLLVLNAPVSEWWKILGLPSRQDRRGSIQVWDSLGIGLITSLDSRTEQRLNELTTRYRESNLEIRLSEKRKVLDEAQESGLFNVSSFYVNIRPEPGPDIDEDGDPVLRQIFKGYLQVNGVGVDAESTLREVSRWGSKSKHPLFYDCLRLDELRRCTANTEVVENGPRMSFGFDVDETKERHVMSFGFSCWRCPRPTP